MRTTTVEVDGGSFLKLSGLCVLLGASIGALGMWADGWDFSEINEHGFSWRTPLALLLYGVAGTLFGGGLLLCRSAMLVFEGKHPFKTTSTLYAWGSDNLGYTHVFGMILLALSVPAAIGWSIWKYFSQ